MAIKVVCPNCGTEMLTSSGAFATPVVSENNGVATLIAKEIHNDNIKKTDKASDRIKALEDAGLNIPKLQTLMQSNADLKGLFASDDPVLEEISKGGFINNPELFRRWITAQNFRLLKDPKGWTNAVRRMYDIKYVFNQTKRELKLLCHLVEKHRMNDIRFNFFTLDDLKQIFEELMMQTTWYSDNEKTNKVSAIDSCRTHKALLDVIESYHWRFRYNTSFKPKAWLNCFKGAGAYYTLQNIIRTHGLILPECKDMNDSLKVVDDIFNSIIGYKPNERRWDIMLSLLTRAVTLRRFELKY